MDVKIDLKSRILQSDDALRQTIPRKGLHNVFHQLAAKRLQPLPGLLGLIHAHVGEALTAEAVGADLGLDIGQPAPTGQADKQYP